MIGRMALLYLNLHIRHMALLAMFITACACEWPPPVPTPIDKGTTPPELWNIALMTYSFGFPLTCDVNVVQTIGINYTRGNFTQGKLAIPVSDYDRLEFTRVTDGDGNDVEFSYKSDGAFYRVYYTFNEPVISPALKTYTFQYTAVQATKTFSRSGSSKNSFTWKTVTKEFQSSIAVFDVILNFGFHTQDDSIDCNPEYSSVEEAERSTTVFFPEQKNIPENSELTHQISFPKRVTCKPASTYKLVAVGVVLGSIIFALVSTIVAVIVRKVKQRQSEQFEQLEET